MVTQSSNSQELANKLAALRGTLSTSAPLPAAKLLRILAPFLLVLCKQSSSSDRTQSIHYLMQEWYVKQPKTDVDRISEYPTDYHPGVCFHCFHLFGFGNGSLRLHCSYCKERPKLTLWLLQDMLEYRYKIHPAWIEKIFAECIVAKSRRDTKDPNREHHGN